MNKFVNAGCLILAVAVSSSVGAQAQSAAVAGIAAGTVTATPAGTVTATVTPTDTASPTATVPPTAEPTSTFAFLIDRSSGCAIHDSRHRTALWWLALPAVFLWRRRQTSTPGPGRRRRSRRPPFWRSP